MGPEQRNGENVAQRATDSRVASIHSVRSRFDEAAHPLQIRFPHRLAREFNQRRRCRRRRDVDSQSCAWRPRRIQWRDTPASERHRYDIGAIKRWLGLFVRRRSSSAVACPTRQRLGSDGSLSPRADYRAPSDAEATVWLAGARTCARRGCAESDVSGTPIGRYRSMPIRVARSCFRSDVALYQ